MDSTQQRDVRTVFVRNISYDVDEAQLQEVFGDVGPVRQFAIPEDAERAVQDLQSHELKGRKLKLESAVKRAPLEERKKKRKHGDTLTTTATTAAAEHGGAAAAEGNAHANAAAASGEAPVASPPKRQRPAPAPQAAAAAAAAAVAKHKLLRAVALGGLTPEAVGRALELARAAGAVDEVLSPASPADVLRAHLAADGCTGGVVFVVYTTIKEAMDAVPKLHGRLVQPPHEQHKRSGKKRKQQAAAAAAEDGQQPAVKLWARAVSGEGAYVKKWRIILRNLPFKVTPAELHTLLDPAGFVWDVHIPIGPDGRSKGFAFASFTCQPHAQKAIEVANGQTLRKRLVAADWAVGKGAFEKVKEAAAGATAVDYGGTGDEATTASEEGRDSGSDDDMGQGHGSVDEMADALPSDDDDGSSEEEEEDGAGRHLDPEVAQEQEMLHSVLDQVLSKEERQQQHEQHKQQAGQQQQQQERQKQQTEPKAKAADAAGAKGAAAPGAEAERGADGAPSTSAPAPLGERSNTVFVRGLVLDVTSQELQARFERFGPVKAARLVLDKGTGKAKGTAFVEFKSMDAAAAAAHACQRARDGKGPDVMVKGRSVEVDLALSKDGARNLAAERAGGSGAGKDKRNLYLAKEGHVEEGSAAWAGMSEQDRAKRKRAAEEKKLKLKSPNFCVSTLRLNVRNIPPSWDEKQLKELFLEAVKERATKEKPRIRQVKILHDTERLDADGAPRSKGIGFVEFDDHSHALAALRQLNNNPRPFGKERRPIVEFAIENAKVLKMRQDKLSKQRERQERRRQERRQGEGGEGAEQGNAGRTSKKRAREAAGTAKDTGNEAGAAGDGEAGVDGGGAGEQKKSRWALRKERRRQQAAEQRQQQQQPLNGSAHPKGIPGKTAAPEADGAAATAQPSAVPRVHKQDRDAARPATPAPANTRQQRQQQQQQARPARRQQQQQQEQQREQGFQQRKRQADDAIDALAQTPANGSSSEGKRRRKGDKAELKLDALIEDYKARLFGAAKPPQSNGKRADKRKGSAGARPAANKQQAQGGAAAAIKRWFE